MKARWRWAAIGIALLLGACQGSFSSGPTIPNTVAQPGAQGQQTAPQSVATLAAQSVGGPEAVNTASPSLAQAQEGFACPDTGGFSCLLKFNLPLATASPSAQSAQRQVVSKGGASPSPSPSASASSSASPSASPSPSPAPSGSGSPSPAPSTNASGAPGSPSPSPSAAPSDALALTITAWPKAVPPMVITNSKSFETVALVRVDLVPSADFDMKGRVEAQFTVPQEQLGGRGFAVQIFEEITHKKKHIDNALLTLPKSTLDKQTLTFDATAPTMTMPKGHHYVVVLYGDERPPSPPPATPIPSLTPPGADFASIPPWTSPGPPTPTPSPTPFH
ncbi:MAG: hypothetical protein JOZ38_08650 [Candidatus Eremiobacteraeota bacterium]|nr:hypothetical protein [Candidatus Eremiobacteraeota bacterium]